MKKQPSSVIILVKSSFLCLLNFFEVSNFLVLSSNDISRIENMDYDAESDLFICQNGKKLKVSGTKFVKSKTGYKDGGCEDTRVVV